MILYRYCQHEAVRSPNSTNLADSRKKRTLTVGHRINATTERNPEYVATRRIALTSSLISLSLWSRPAEAFEFVEAKKIENGILLDANDFEVIIPENFVDLGIPQPKKATFSATPGAPPPPSPVKARYGSPDSSSFVTVVVREASSIKPTFIQLSDISSWGNGTEVAQLLLPRSAKIRNFDKVVIPKPPKDTGTVAGVVEVPPLVIYRYVFNAGADQVVRLAAAALKGRVYIMAAQARVDADGDTVAGMQRAFDSFRCKEEFKPLF